MTSKSRTLLNFVCAALFALPAVSSLAETAGWSLDAGASSVNFISIKNDAVGEVHSFGALSGQIGKGGDATLSIDLDSVDTLIPIRNERMREMLFETAKFPSATVTASVDPEVLSGAGVSGVVRTDLPVTLSLHGMEKTWDAALVVIGQVDGGVRVFSATPILVNAADFGLDAGVTALREIAGLKAISNSVPVTLELVFVPAAK